TRCRCTRSNPSHARQCPATILSNVTQSYRVSNYIVADKQVSIPSNYEYLNHATRVDDTHVRIELKRVFPAALEYMAMTLYVMPKAYREKVGPQEYSLHPVGSGPFKITKVTGIAQVDMER